MRIVLDTNVALSALLWRGTPYALLRTVRRRPDLRLFASPALLTELADVLTRPVPTKRLSLIARAGQDVLADYREALEMVVPLSTPAVVAADPDDDPVIAAAVAAEADMLVSGDRHLLVLDGYDKIRIVTPAEAFRIVSEA
jgi:putative PIN family toxin of toxin-antitoxin system